MPEFTPHPYQQECIEFLAEVPRAGLLLDMGLGKTAIVLSSIHDFMFSSFDTRRTLVIAPKNVALIAWPGELEKWDQFKAINYTVLHGPEKDERIRTRQDLYIINYDGLKWLVKQYLKASIRPFLPRFDCVVIDESTFIKNGGAKRSQIIKALLAGVPRMILLTGTPAPNGLIDLYGQMDLIKPGMLARTLTSYRDSYFLAPNVNGGQRKWLPRRGTKDIIAGKMAPFVKVMKEVDVLPRDAAVDNLIYCDLPDKYRGEYNRLEKEFFLQLDNGVGVEAFNASSLSMKLRQYVQGFLYAPEQGGAVKVNTVKLDVLVELLEGNGGRPILCAIQFKHEVALIRERLKYRVPALYGETTEKEARDNIAAWSNGDVPLLLAHPKSGGIGLNLQEGGSTIVWLAQTWDAQDYDQTNARIDRQGQPEPVVIHNIVMRDTVDELIVSARTKKILDQGALMDAIQEYRRKRGL